MTTSAELERAARALSEGLANEDEAVAELLRLSDGHRVSLVMARQHILDSGIVGEGDAVSERALGFVETALRSGTWTA
jgi:hypothetical protein